MKDFDHKGHQESTKDTKISYSFPFVSFVNLVVNLF
jgi:hypothetical protein